MGKGSRAVAFREREWLRLLSLLLEEIVTENLGAAHRETNAEADRQRQLHAKAAQFAGRICGTDTEVD